MIIAATGHRPDKLGGYHPAILERLTMLARKYFNLHEPDEIITGMALGWDTAVAQAAIDLGIPFVAAVPFEGQESRWPQRSQHNYRLLLKSAARIEIVGDGNNIARMMQRRNEWMVDHCDRMVALYDGSLGGTHNCLRYADARYRPYDNLWNEWLRINR